MPAADFPADLLALKVRFLTVEAEISALAAKMPTGRAIVAGEEEPSAQDSAAWHALHLEAAELAGQLSEHPHLAAMAGPDRLTAMEALTRAAREQLHDA